jgi:hypothetical protein
MHTLTEIAKALNRPIVYLSGLQSRFELPVLPGAGYSEAYLAFFRVVIHLRTLGIAEDRLRELWDMEKKLLVLLHLDTSGSPTWFLDSCGATTHPKRRLLLTNHDVGVEIHGTGVQPGLNFAGEATPELFAGPEMGEDALRVLHEYRKLYARICADAKAEAPHVREAAKWAARL